MHSLYKPIRNILWPKTPFTHCLLLWCGILTAGLWPFSGPRNEVTWLHDEPALSLDGYNVLFSSRMVNSSGSECSVELLLTPKMTFDSSTVLSFYTPDNPLQFSLQQRNDSLVLSSDVRLEKRETESIVESSHVFRKGQQLFVAVTVSAEKTAIYIDGQLTKDSTPFPFAGQICSGKLLLGNSAVRVDSWWGHLQGVAVYSGKLSPQEILADYRSWLAQHRPEIASGKQLVALYLMNRGGGHVIYNEIPSGSELYIPTRYKLVGQPFLDPPWKEYHHAYYWVSIGPNVAAFVPLGWFVYGYLSRSFTRKTAFLAAVLFGTGTSLTMEILQAYLPTRQSGTTDIVTNTVGTLLGVLLWLKVTPRVASRAEEYTARPCS